MPPEPSTSTSVPSCHRVVAFSTPATQGMPYSLATSAPCWSAPPTSKIMPPAFTKSGVHRGSVARATRISPLSKGFSSGVCKTFMLPRTLPVETAGADIFAFLQGRSWRARNKPAGIDNGRRFLCAREPFEEDGVLARELSQIHRMIVSTCVKLLDGQIEYLFDR